MAQGTATPAAIAGLRADIAAADLGSFRSDYRCTGAGCPADEDVTTLSIAADGVTFQFLLGGAPDVPAGLQKINVDVNAIDLALP